MSMSKNDKFHNSFFEECEELLEAMHDGFDRMAQDMGDGEIMNAIFRAVHSIKGGAGAFGLNDLVAFSHHFETALDKVRSGQVAADDGLLELFRQCGDQLSDLVAAARGDGDIDESKSDALRSKLNDAIGEDTSIEVEMPDFEPVALAFEFDDVEDQSAGSGCEIEFSAKQSLFASGNEPTLLFKALESLGSVSVSANLDSVPHLSDLSAGECSITWHIKIVGEVAEYEVREVFEFVEEDCSLAVSVSASDIEEDAPPVLGSLPTLGGACARL